MYVYNIPSNVNSNIYRKSTREFPKLLGRFTHNPLIRSDEGLTLETSAIVSFTASNTLINTGLIHQFVFRRADAVT